MSGSRRPYSRGPRYYKDYWDHDQQTYSEGSSAGSPKESSSCVSPPAAMPTHSHYHRSPPPYPPPRKPPREHAHTHTQHHTHTFTTLPHDWRRPATGGVPGPVRRPVDRRPPPDWLINAQAFAQTNELRMSPDMFRFRSDYDVRVAPPAPPAQPADLPKRGGPTRHQRHYPPHRAHTAHTSRAVGRAPPDPLLSAPPPLLLPPRYHRGGVVARRWVVVPPYPVLVSWLLPLPAPHPARAHTPPADNYDALLALAARLQDDKPRGLSPARIAALPHYRWRGAEGGGGGSSGGGQSSCVVCLSEFVARECVRVLPCSHEYHARCVDRWLRTNRSCPICRRDCH